MVADCLLNIHFRKSPHMNKYPCDVHSAHDRVLLKYQSRNGKKNFQTKSSNRFDTLIVLL
jgi:hypothetical protein